MNRTAVIAIGRRENRYAREFVEHHLTLGFETVIIADNNHAGEEHFEDVLQDYIDAGLVIVEDYREREACQLTAYNEIYEKYGEDYDWMAFFDFDEHLCLTGCSTLEQLLGEDDFIVCVNWQCYGDNGLVSYDDRPLSERFIKPLKHPLFVQYAERPENDHVKSILRTRLGYRFTRNPHVIFDQSPLQPFNPTYAVLRHYITKTAEEWADKMRRGTADRRYEHFVRDYRDRFFKYNERTKEKERYMELESKKERTVAIVHYNTPELTEATIKSIRKHGGEDYKVVIFDNSNLRPWKKRMKGVRKIDNTQGQVIDFEAELAKYPHKHDGLGIHGRCVYGSAKHMMSVQKLFDLLPEGFLLVDSDILLRQNVDFMFREDRCAVGHIQTADKAKNPFRIERMVPMLCYINVPMCRKCGIDYFDPHRAWALQPGGTKNRLNWYDTGASFLEDLRNHKGGAIGRRIDIRPLMVHLVSGSWKHSDVKQQAEWLEQNRELWE